MTPGGRLWSLVVSALEFISSIAWPLTVLVVALVFRQTITGMLSGQLRSLDAGPLSLVWDRNAGEVRAELVPSKAREGGDDHRDDLVADATQLLTSGLVAELSPLAEQSPAAAILEAYSRVESKLRDLLGNPPVDPGLDLRRIGGYSLAKIAAERGLISAKTQRAVEGIGVLRNLAAHGQVRDLTPERAIEYLTLVDGTLFAIRMDVAKDDAA